MKLVIGYGNPLRGDDGVGWRIASLLTGALPNGAARILAVHQLTPELAETVSEAELVIFVDASAVGMPGTWKCEEITPRPAAGIAPGHFFEASTLLAYTDALYRTTPRALLVSVAAGSLALNDNQLTPAVAATLPDVVRHLRATLLCPENRQPGLLINR